MRKLLAMLFAAMIVFLVSGCGSNNDESGPGDSRTHMITIQNEARSSSNIIEVYLRTPDTDRFDPLSADWGEARSVNIAPGSWDDLFVYECDRHYDTRVIFSPDLYGVTYQSFTYNIGTPCDEESTYTFQNID